jgi:hypothetical protein
MIPNDRSGCHHINVVHHKLARVKRLEVLYYKPATLPMLTLLHVRDKVITVHKIPKYHLTNALTSKKSHSSYGTLRNRPVSYALGRSTQTCNMRAQRHITRFPSSAAMPKLLVGAHSFRSSLLKARHRIAKVGWRCKLGLEH